MKIKSTFMTIALLMIGAWASAHEGAKIGVVDPNAVIQDCAKGKAFFEEYEAFLKDKESQIKTMVDNLQAGQKDFQAKAASLSEEKALALRADLEKQQTTLQRAQEDAEREAKAMLNDKLTIFEKEIGPIVRQVAEEKKLDLVLTRSQNMAFVSEAVNITADVIKKYDEQQ